MFIFFFKQIDCSYPNKGLYGDGKVRTHKEMLDIHMTGLLALAQENNPDKNECYQKQKKAAIAYGKAYWLATTNLQAKQECEKHLLTLKAPEYLRKCFPYNQLSETFLFTKGLFGTWKNY